MRERRGGRENLLLSNSVFSNDKISHANKGEANDAFHVYEKKEKWVKNAARKGEEEREKEKKYR